MSKKLYEKYISTHFSYLHKADSKELENYRKHFAANFNKLLPSDKMAPILDIGAGMGHFLYYLKTSGYRNYLGIDFSEENISFCQQKQFNVELAAAAEFLTDKKDMYKAIVLNDIIEHFTIDEAVDLLHQIKQALMPGGVVIIKTVNMAHPIVGSSSRYVDLTHKSGFTEESIRQLLRLTEFKDVNVKPSKIYVFYLNPFNYIAIVVSWFLNLFVWRFLFLLYGRKSTKIFHKTFIAIAKK